MGQKKLIRFAEIAEFRNVLQYPQAIKGKWLDHFHNNHPLTLELACGKGEYTIGLATMHPERNFIGVDLKGNRIWVGAKKGLTNNLQNAAFLRTHIDKITDYFEAGEVAEIWITFPDPQLRVSHAKKRLTHPKYLRHFQKILQPGGKLHLKTDSPDLYKFTLTVLKMFNCHVHVAWDDVYSRADRIPELDIKTHYEGLDIAGSNKIHYICFSLPIEELPQRDMELKEFLKQEQDLNN